MKWKAPQTIEELIRQTRQEIRSHVTHHDFKSRWSYAYVGLSLIVLLALFQLSAPWPVARCLLPVAWSGAVWLILKRSNRLGSRINRTPDEINKILRFLMKHGDQRVLGVLIEALATDQLFLRDSALREMVVDNIAELLPFLDAGNIGLLDTEQRRCLCSLLASPNPNETFLYVAILQALVVVGGQEAVEVMEKYADSALVANKIDLLEDNAMGLQRLKPSMRKRDYHYEAEQMRLCLWRLQEVSAECLPPLRERLAREKVTGTLLRPANPLLGSPDELLRPAVERSETEPNQLLRATVSERETDR